MWLFLAVSWVGLQCVIVVFPDHTLLIFGKNLPIHNCSNSFSPLHIYVTVAKIDFFKIYFKKVLSKTTRPMVLIFGMEHYLVDIYPHCSNNAPGAKMPHPGFTWFT